MSGYTLRQFGSLADLRRAAPAWNDLWQRTPAARPTARAEQLAIWCECFVPGNPFQAIGVESAGQLVAALPLYRARRWMLPSAHSLGNTWSPGGQLLLDHSCDVASVCGLLINGLRRNVPGLLSLDGLLLDAEICQALLRQLGNDGTTPLVRRRFTAPLVEIRGSWHDYLETRSGNLRRQLKSISRRAESSGGARLVQIEHPRADDVEPLLRKCCELEVAGWKGRESSAVLSDPRAWTFFLRQARQLVNDGQLAMAILQLDDQLLAFEYGWQSGGVRGVLKIGYDESCARLSPGQLLRYRLLERLFEQRTVRWLDFIGPTSRATGQWATHEYEVGRCLTALGSRRAAVALAGYRLVRKARRRIFGTAGASHSGKSEPSTGSQSPAAEPREYVATAPSTDLDNRPR